MFSCDTQDIETWQEKEAEAEPSIKTRSSALHACNVSGTPDMICAMCPEIRNFRRTTSETGRDPFPLSSGARAPHSEHPPTSAVYAVQECGLTGSIGNAHRPLLDVRVGLTSMMRENGNDLSVSGVASVDRALLVLAAFKRGDKVLSLAELTRRTRLVKTTVLRLAISLEQAGLIKRLDDGAYRLDAEVLRLASIYQDQIDLESLVVPVLRQLMEETQESASFYIRRGEQRMCLFRVDSPHRLRLHIRPGDLLSMDESAIAQVLRTFDDRESPRPTCPTLPIYTAGKRDPHTAGLAMPVFSGESRLAGALAISGPVTRFTAERANAVSPSLISMAMELTRSLGGDEQRLQLSGPALKFG
jgi:DNA-binding IclR family transcriptional regulator